MQNNFLSDEIFLALTAYGNPIFYLLLVAVLMIFNVSFAVPLLLALLFIEILCVFIKLMYHKDRPTPQSREGLFNKIDANTFPSVHSARSALIAMVVIFYFNIPVLSIIAIIFMLGVGYSRIYLKRHYLIDVLGGFLMGIITGLMLINICNI